MNSKSVTQHLKFAHKPSDNQAFPLIIARLFSCSFLSSFTQANSQILGFGKRVKESRSIKVQKSVYLEKYIHFLGGKNEQNKVNTFSNSDVIVNLMFK